MKLLPMDSDADNRYSQALISHHSESATTPAAMEVWSHSPQLRAFGEEGGELVDVPLHLRPSMMSSTSDNGGDDDNRSEGCDRIMACVCAGQGAAFHVDGPEGFKRNQRRARNDNGPGARMRARIGAHCGGDKRAPYRRVSHLSSCRTASSSGRSPPPHTCAQKSCGAYSRVLVPPGSMSYRKTRCLSTCSMNFLKKSFSRSVSKSCR